MKHFFVVGQPVKRKDNIWQPSFTSDHRIVAMNDDWSIVRYREEFRLCKVTEPERMTDRIKARFNHGPILLACDLQHTWAEIQDFRFVQTSVTGKRGFWFVTRWLRENVDPNYQEQINTVPLYGSTLKKCTITGGPIDITEHCV